MKKFSFSKVAGSKPLILLKMNFFIDIFQELRPQPLEHLFPKTPLTVVSSIAYFVLVFIIEIQKHISMVLLT